LLLHVAGSRLAPCLEAGDRVLDRVRGAQQFGEHDGVFDGHGAAFAHVWRAGMGGVADEQDPAGVPAVQVDGLDRPEMDLLVAGQGGEVAGNQRSEAVEVLAEPVQAPRGRVVERFAVQAGEPVGVPAAHRDQPEVAPLSGENHEVIHAAGPGGDDAPPAHGTCVAGRLLGHGQAAHGGVDAVRADDKVIFAGRAVGEHD
jgi:hypothetical protein